MLCDGRDGLTHFTEHELLAAGVERRLLDDPAYVRAGMVLDGIETFDADFFRVSAHEAVVMDPQQRMLLECAWHALEDAGRPPRSDNRRVGVYVGGRASDYLLYCQEAPDIFGHFEPSPIAGLQRLVLNDKDYLATRLAYLLDLCGPAVTLQTACSTSLVATHMACQALLNGECDLALAGGVSVRVPQRVGYLYSDGMIFPPDGRTRPFDANANGPLVGSGLGIVVLRRLDDAIADGDRVYAVVLGSAVNNDGAIGKAAFTGPSLAGQVRVVAEAIAVSQIDPGSLSYIEAHGTSTRVGDPVEIAALNEVFGSAAPRGSCAIGSVKSNIGHLFHAAGVIGLIKTALMLHHGMLVPTVGFERPNPLIDFESSSFFVNTTRRPWRSAGAPRRAGVSAFGFGGTNAHVVLQEAPAAVERSRGAAPFLLPLSARSETALRELAASYTEVLSTESDLDPADLCFTAQQGRRHFQHRMAIVGSSVAAIKDRLAAALEERNRPAGDEAEPEPKVAFVFSGQGTQHAGMGHELYASEAVFRDAIDQCGFLLERELDQRLADVLFGADAAAHLARTDYAQPALCAFELALASLWRSWGLEPAVVVGHSLGEIAAACTAGILTLEDALRLAAVRGRLMQQAQSGAMAVIGAPRADVEEIVGCRAAVSSIAAINGDGQIVISGARPVIVDVVTNLQRDGVPARLLAGESAFHSPLMDPVVEDLSRFAAGLAHGSPACVFVSTSMAQQLSGDVDWPRYWSRQARDPVRFVEAVNASRRVGANVFVEIGPDATLTALLSGGRELACASIRRGRSEREQMLSTAAALYERGVDVNWPGIMPEGGRRISLPAYPFERRQYWTQKSPAPAALPSAHPLLGERVPSPLKEVQFHARLTANVAPYVRDHWVYGVRPLVFVGQLEMMRAAAVHALHGESSKAADVTITNMLVERPLLLSDEHRVVQTVVTPTEDGMAAVDIYSQTETDAAWERHSSGQVDIGSAADPVDCLDIDALQRRCSRVTSGETIRRRKRDKGADIGPAFETVSQAWCGEREALVDVAVPPDDAAHASLYGAYPGLLDACAQCADLTLDEHDIGYDKNLFLPMVANRVVFRARLPQRVWVYLKRRDDAEGDMYGVDAAIADQSGNVLIRLEGLFFKRATPASLRGTKTSTDAELYHVVWVPVAPQEKSVALNRDGWLVLADRGDVSDAIVRGLQTHGAVVVVEADANVGVEALRARLATLGSSQARCVLDLRSLECAAPRDPVEDARRACRGALDLVQAMLQEGIEGPLWFVTRGAQTTGREIASVDPGHASLWGFARVIQREQPSLDCRLVDLDPAIEDQAEALIEVLRTSGAERAVALRAGVQLAPRLRRVDRPGSAANAAACQLRPGSERTLEGLSDEPAERRMPAAGEIEIEVRATGLNFRDVLNATGRIDGPLGYECSGIVTRCGPEVVSIKPGDAVMALAPHSFATYVTVDARLTVPKPAWLSFGEAAGIVVAYLTAYYALVEHARVRPGDRVLVHTAAGGVGLAALQLARAAGADVFATASRAKWRFLKDLGVTHIFDSRVPGYAGDLLAATNGEGVNVVLNTLGPEFAPDNLAVLRPNGFLIELGHPGMHDFRASAAAAESRGVRFVNFHIAQELGEADPTRLQAMLCVLTNWLADGRIRPLPSRVFAWDDVREAFETMLRGAHVGKLVIEHSKPLAPSDERLPDGTYLVTGGLGAVGWQLVEWLVSRGARHLALVNRRAPSSAKEDAIQALARDGVIVKTYVADVADRHALAEALDRISVEQPPLRGIVHAAGTVDDGVVAEQDWVRFEGVLGPKVAGAWHLHELTDGLRLDFIVLISSAAGLLGNPGQTNYAAANAFLDQLAHWRRQRGLPALAIHYGLWAGAGMGRSLSAASRVRRRSSGMRELQPEAAVRALDQACNGGLAQAAVLDVDWEAFAGAQPDGVPALVADLSLAADRKRALDSPSGPGRPPITLEETIDRIGPHVRALTDAPGAVDSGRSLSEAGLDSLAVLLLRGRLVAEFGVVAALPVLRFLEGRSLKDLAQLIWQRASHPSPARPAPPAKPVSPTSSARSLTTIRSGECPPPSVLVPPAGRTVMPLESLAKRLLQGHAVCGLNPVGIEGAADPHTRIEDMAADYIRELRARFPSGPYILGGMCFGSLVAWEMAVQLGPAEAALFISIDGNAPRPAGGIWRRLACSVNDSRRYYSVRLRHHVRQRSLAGALRRQAVRLATRRSVVDEWLEGGLAAADPVVHPLFAAQQAAWLKYRAKPFTGRTLLVFSQQSVDNKGPEYWTQLGMRSPGIVVFPETTHTELLSEPFAPMLADAISQRIRELAR